MDSALLAIEVQVAALTVGLLYALNRKRAKPKPKRKRNGRREEDPFA